MQKFLFVFFVLAVFSENFLLRLFITFTPSVCCLLHPVLGSQAQLVFIDHRGLYLAEVCLLRGDGGGEMRGEDNCLESSVCFYESSTCHMQYGKKIGVFAGVYACAA